jgi:plasmid stabilization system protein ParE
MEKIAGVDFLTTAEAELFEAIAWYNEQNRGLGFEFGTEISKTIDRIVQNPLAWQALSKRTRQCRTNRFPYAVIYQIRQDRVLIVSIMHMKREPSSWRSRLSSHSQ